MHIQCLRGRRSVRSLEKYLLGEFFFKSFSFFYRQKSKAKRVEKGGTAISGRSNGTHLSIFNSTEELSLANDIHRTRNYMWKEQEYGLRVARMFSPGHASGTASNELLHHRQLVDLEINETWLPYRHSYKRSTARWLQFTGKFGNTVNGEAKEKENFVIEKSWQKTESLI